MSRGPRTPVMERGAQARLLHNMSVPPRTTVESWQRAVSDGVTVFSVPHACAAAGLLRGNIGVCYADAEQRARERWRGDVTALLAAIGGIERVEEAGRRYPFLTQGAIVGWTPDDNELLRCCRDVAVCLAVLSRRVGDLYLARRDADLSWRAVFRAPFAIDDERACAWRCDR